MAPRPTLALLLFLLAGCATPDADDGVPTGEPDATSIPDPLVGGPRSVTRLEYDFGQYVVDDSSLPLRYTVPLHGSLHLPDGAGAGPLVVLLHGRHVTCSYVGVEFLSAACAEAPPVLDPIDSYTGYDGLAANLASWGYPVASIDANTINDRDLAGDAGANARGAVVLRTLDELASVNATGHGLGTLGGSGLPASAPANTPERDVSAAQGRLDLSRVGLMGHSRGGEGVARAVTLDLERHGGAHGLDAVFALAPTDFARWPVPGVAFATLLPYCDGDVYNLQGAWMYDDARRLEPAAPRHQILAMGANHNFYNTVWTGDDWGATGEWCGTDVEGSGRDSPEGQRAHGYGLMASFFRLHVGGEQAFAPLWDGAGSVFPASFCPEHASCEGRLHASAMPIRHLDLAADGMPSVQERLEPTRCQGSGCPSRPGYSTAAQASWNCHGAGAATFAVDGLDSWRAFSMRVANRPPGGNPLHVTVSILGVQAMLPVLAADPAPGELGFPARPGDPEAEPGAKTIPSEVRFPFPDDADLSEATAIQVRCDGDGGIQVTDLMLV